MVGQEGLLREAKQDRDPHSSTEHIRTLQSRAPSLCPPLPQEPWRGLQQHQHLFPPQGASRSPHLLHHPGGTRPHALQEGVQLVLGQAPSAGCVEAHQKFHLEAARGQGLGSSLSRQSEGKGGLVQLGSRDGSQFEFLPKDGQQFT